MGRADDSRLPVNERKVEVTQHYNVDISPMHKRILFAISSKDSLEELGLIA